MNIAKRKIQSAEEAKKALEASKDEASKKELEAEIFQNLVDSKLYQPSTKWLFENNQCDTTEPVFMYLKKQKWLDEESSLVEQRLTQMYILPDVLPPGVVLDAKLNVDFGGEVFPGTKVDPATTQTEPKISIDCFHKEFKKYTLVMVDPDHPAPEIQNYREKFHWAICNISVNAASKEYVNGDVLLKYIPPHPAQGTKFHRYTFVLLEQPEDATPSTIQQALEASDATVRSLVEKHGFVARGLHFFRAEWSPAVSAIYKDAFGIPEPVFGPRPIVDPRIGPDGRIRNKYHNA
ncbi:mitochondrial 54S ribosomal protein YmL35 [Entomophthora muscae]|uniref:Mitochondrial 54S ribosomal protein YmL35 n=1 Tax=Entomophthora muscae TaxID=34485 RepID=A0ACC2UQP3_9FUNG|nr:mitochondrial 54S ribosomal protein YmL35 [Entomophthora muscae]